MRPSPALAAALAPLALFTLACAGGGGTPPDYVVPSLSDPAASDESLPEVDRAAALAGALAPDQASAGLPFDLTAAPAGFRMDVEGNAGAALDGAADTGADTAPAGPSGTYANVVHAAGMVLTANTATSYVLGVPAAAIAVTRAGTTTEIDTNVWASTNTVTYDGGSVTGLFVVAWVEVGWVAQLRLWTSDGRLDNTLWLNGFVSADQQVGWWDMFDPDGTAVGALEWTADTAGNGQFGIAAFTGDAAGDVLGYGVADGVSAVGFHDASLAYDYSVVVQADTSGQLIDPQWNGGAPACWGADSMDVSCE